MGYLRNKIIGTFFIVILSISFMPFNTYAERSCDEKKGDCYEECDEVFEGDNDIIELGRAVCKGGCQVAKLACHIF